ncbi:MAG: DUF1311 domain-containing protein [Ottowia sp.]|nr:DUF1311 domain-containing protein [Ottowia sp.]
MKQGIFSLPCAALLALFSLTGASALAQEAPDLQACIDRTAYREDVPVQAFHACYDESTGYWDKQLNDRYQKARAGCAAATKPDECRQKLRHAERLWMQYRDAMSAAFDQVSSGAGMGAMPARGTVYRATRHQAEELDFFIRQAESFKEAGQP